ncbi:replication protein [Pantoea anthophila]|uniref:replication protein n=1 Tax=Pantoea anthophila TaxID=470931 RepID=UPI002DBA3C34|nr:replication protein [Pantoea anthophila]
MSNVALDNVSPIKPHLKVVERRVAELEDGYTKLSNVLLEEYAGADITKRQFKVLLAILRKTYGWNKPMDRISDSQLSEIAKLPVKRCNEAKLELVRMGLVKQQGGMFGPNKNVDEWRIPQSEGISPKLRDKTSPKLRERNPSKQGDTKDTIKNTKENTPLTPQGGESDLAQECLDFYNLTTDSRCSSTAPFEKALSTVKAKGVCYSSEEVKLVTLWAFKVWKNKPSPNNLCRMTRFDTYLSDALKWNDCTERNPEPCPHEKLVSLWNTKFPERAVEMHEWNKTRPAYQGMERVWNSKTNNGSWREVKHIATVFDLIRKSKLCDGLHDKHWLTLDWILDAKNWAKVYEQARREYKLSQQGVPA